MLITERIIEIGITIYQSQPVNGTLKNLNLKTRKIITFATAVRSTPPIAPSHVFFGLTTGAILCLAGIVTIYANWIHTICDAVKSAKRINAENGYAMYQFNDRCAFGIQPSIAYECPQYLTCNKPELSAGMKFKLTF